MGRIGSGVQFSANVDKLCTVQFYKVVFCDVFILVTSFVCCFVVGGSCISFGEC